MAVGLSGWQGALDASQAAVVVLPPSQVDLLASDHFCFFLGDKRCEGFLWTSSLMSWPLL